jgi:hypothetical protein
LFPSSLVLDRRWFLNAFWEDGMEKEAEHLWKWSDKIKTYDLQKGADGCDLDELNAHRFLEFHKVVSSSSLFSALSPFF